MKKELKEMTNFLVGNVSLQYVTRNTAANRPVGADSDTLARVAEAAYCEQGCMIDYCEYLFVILMSKNGKVLGAVKVGEGSTDSCSADIKKIMAAVILSGASNIALAHNHPQSGARPSRADRQLTCSVQNACSIFGVRLLDHIILADYAEDGHHRYYSMKDNADI